MTALALGTFKPLKFSSGTLAMTVSGNSISDAAVSDLIPQLQALPPISSQITIANAAVNGYSIQQLAASPGAVDGSYVAGKTNILLIFEITNNIFNDSRTGLQTISDLQSYINARIALHPWVVVLQTALPRGDHFGATYSAVNGEVELQVVNNYIRQNYKTMGAKAYIESRRSGGPFDFTDATNSVNFPALLWTDKTHPNTAGKAILAQYMVDVLKRLPTR